MAKVAAEPGERLDDADITAVRSPAPSREWVYRTLGEWAVDLYPNAIAARLVIDIPNGAAVASASLPIPLPAPSDATVEDRIVAFLSGFHPETWVKGRVIAAEVDMEYGGGQFGKVMAELSKVKKILESNTAGYRLKS